MQRDNFYEFNFKEFRLLRLNFELKRDKKYRRDDIINISANLSLKYDVKDKNQLRLNLGIDICEENLPFTLNSEIGGMFVFTKQINGIPEIDKIARINCAAIVFPYLREIVADVIRRAGLPELNLPPINFVDVYRSQIDSQKKDTKLSNK